MTGFSLLMFLAAVCGLVAAGCWFRVSTAMGANGEIIRGTAGRKISQAAVATALAIGLASAGMLIDQLAASL